MTTLLTPQQAEEMTDKTCASRIDAAYESTMEDLRKLWSAYCQDECPDCEGVGYKDSPTNVLESDSEPEQIECELCKGTGELDEDSYGNEIGNLFEYGLSFDYVSPSKNNPEGYFRYQFSWGGPSDEMRIYAQKINDCRFSVYKVAYWFMDWFDSAHKNLSGDDFKFIDELFTQFFVDSGTANSVYEDEMTIDGKITGRKVKK
jgi:hypothetical protein